MSAFTTIQITRSAAKKKLIEHLSLDVSDERLEDFLDRLLAEHLYNVRVVDDGEENADFLLS